MISIPADKNNKAIILDVGGKKHKIRGELIEPTTRSRLQLCQAPRLDKEKGWTLKKLASDLLNKNLQTFLCLLS